MQTRSHRVLTPQITEPAVFTSTFYLYACIDVHYWSSGVPISLWSPTPPNQQWLVSAMTMHVRTTATGAGHHHGLPNSTRQKDDLEKIKGGGGLLSILIPDILIFFFFFYSSLVCQACARCKFVLEE